MSSAEQLQLDTSPACGDAVTGTAATRTAAAATATTAADVADRDRFRATVPQDVPDALAPFVHAGILTSADVHVARMLTVAGGDDRSQVLLAAALAVRAPRLQHVCVDLTEIADTAVTEEETAPAPALWPTPDHWRETLTSSPLVAVRDPDDTEVVADRDVDVRPLVLVGERLYLDRYWRYERQVAAALRRRAATLADGLDLERLRDGLDRLAPPPEVAPGSPDRQRVAAAAAVMRHLTVIAGGPGTGKTTTVAQVLCLLDEQAQAVGGRAPRIALAAPTGKAAQRLTEALHEAATRLPAGPEVRARLATAEASTLHRLLGYRPGSTTRFRHDRDDPLPYDAVIVDETSMVSLSLMAKLLAAVPTTSRLILVGDPDQLASVEAGSVLGDVVGRPAGDRQLTAEWHAHLQPVVGPRHLAGLAATPDAAGIDDVIVVLERVHRFHGGIAELAAAVQDGDAERALALLEDRDDLAWIRPDDTAALDQVRQEVTDALAPMVVAAGEGQVAQALAVLDQARILCAHRRGDDGVRGWTARVEGWLADAVGPLGQGDRWYPGRPVLVTENDHQLGLFNGDVGVTVARPDGIQVAFPGSGDEPRWFGPARLPETQTVHAMTIHKSQGSQLDHAVVVLPERVSPILTRELLYTAVTRARQRVTVVAPEEALRAAIDRRVRRSSGLEPALRRGGWPHP